ncbi:MAG: polymerase sigma factor, sigma-70 family [Planctomycetaceae bacterium]|nr:polymerase sigma factor, sigma-70 family [Planctomycetaceae bacterium]
MTDSIPDAHESTAQFAELLARVRDGDEAATTRLVERYEARVRLTARVLLGPALRPHLDSVDIAQSVHRTLLFGLKHDKFDLNSSDQLLALLLTVVRRKVAHQWRKAQRQRRLSSAPDTVESPVSLLASMVSPQIDPAGSAAINDSITQLLQGLDGTDRQAIELRLTGYSTVEVAAELGLDARVLRARFSRLRQRLRERGILSEWL